MRRLEGKAFNREETFIWVDTVGGLSANISYLRNTLAIFLKMKTCVKDINMFLCVIQPEVYVPIIIRGSCYIFFCPKSKYFVNPLILFIE